MGGSLEAVAASAKRLPQDLVMVLEFGRHCRQNEHPLVGHARLKKWENRSQGALFTWADDCHPLLSHRSPNEEGESQIVMCVNELTLREPDEAEGTPGDHGKGTPQRYEAETTPPAGQCDARGQEAGAGLYLQMVSPGRVTVGGEG
ncbi:hypothetical protein P7K49_018384 [Saguinus oedipus]|uniref:Uncharacterized protein n=1 Tax=Saguinus oedipus TaxID=9490 RepID=A0ABQ9V779_SAGOE|nr:hypothetical protein P7K49_018384 [Saguinus oedipus]